MIAGTRIRYRPNTKTARRPLAPSGPSGHLPRASHGCPGKTRLTGIAACFLKKWVRGDAEIKIQHRGTEGTEEGFARIRAQVLSPCPLCLCGSRSLLRVSAAPREPFPGKFEFLSRTCPLARKSQLGSSPSNPSPIFSPDSPARFARGRKVRCDARCSFSSLARLRAGEVPAKRAEGASARYGFVRGEGDPRRLIIFRPVSPRAHAPVPQSPATRSRS